MLIRRPGDPDDVKRDIDSARRHYHRQRALIRATTESTDVTRCCANRTRDERTGELLHRVGCPVLERTTV